MVANAIDLPGHPAVLRVPASDVQVESDLGARLVTRGVGRLQAGEIAMALDGGQAAAARLMAGDAIHAAVLHCQGATRICRPDNKRQFLSRPDHDSALREHATG